MFVRAMRHGEMILCSAGRYADAIQVAGDNPCFARRNVVNDFSRYHTPIVMSL
jgi:hypothetical protein